jgi:hypothetical protein
VTVRNKMLQQVKVEIRKEHNLAIAEQHSALDTGLATMDFDARVKHIHSLAVQVGLLDEPRKGGAGLPKHPKTPLVATALKATTVAGKRQDNVAAAKVVAEFISLAAACQPTAGSPPEPSPCLAAGEDDLTPKVALAPMDWAEDTSVKLPPIDFDSKEHSTSSSIHCEENTMVDTPVAVASFQDVDSGALTLSPLVTPPAEAPQSEVAQLFQLIMATTEPIKTELKCIGDKVDGHMTPHTTNHSRKAMVSSAPSSHPLPSLPHPSPPPALVSPVQRVDDEEQEVIALISNNSEFPPLAPPAHRSRHAHGTGKGADTAETVTRNSLVPGALAPVQRHPGSSHQKAPPIFTLVITAKGLGNHIAVADKARQVPPFRTATPWGK